MIENTTDELVENPASKPPKSELINYYNINFIGEIIIRILTGFTLLETLTEKPLSFRHLLSLYLSYYIFKVIFNATYLVTFSPNHRRYKQTFLFELIYYISALIFTYAAYLVTIARLDAKLLPMFVAPIIIASFSKVAIGLFDDVAYLQTPIYHALESI